MISIIDQLVATIALIFIDSVFAASLSAFSLVSICFEIPLLFRFDDEKNNQNIACNKNALLSYVGRSISFILERFWVRWQWERYFDSLIDASVWQEPIERFSASSKWPSFIDENTVSSFHGEKFGCLRGWWFIPFHRKLSAWTSGMSHRAHEIYTVFLNGICLAW